MIRIFNHWKPIQSIQSAQPLPSINRVQPPDGSNIESVQWNRWHFQPNQSNHTIESINCQLTSNIEAHRDNPFHYQRMPPSTNPDQSQTRNPQFYIGWDVLFSCMLLAPVSCCGSSGAGQVRWRPMMARQTSGEGGGSTCARSSLDSWIRIWRCMIWSNGAMAVAWIPTICGCRRVRLGPPFAKKS